MNPKEKAYAMTKSSMLKAALDHAQKGRKVFPLHTPDGQGGCSCKNAECDNAGKHPRTKNGFKDAITDPEQIKKWWSMWPDANIGTPTGSGVLVLDVDKTEALYQLEDQHEPLPETRQQKTGRGFQFFFRYDRNVTIRSAVSVVDGIDVRATGGYVILPPSLHSNGRKYKWMQQVKAAPVPMWLLEMVTEKRTRKTTEEIPDRIPKGMRNDTLTSYAGVMRRAGFDSEAIFAALKATTQKRCDPPLNDIELKGIANSISRYPPASSQGEPEENPWMSACPAPEFLSAEDPEQDWLEENMLAPGSITDLFSPRGIGKTLVGHGIGIRQALNGKSVLLLDRDNSHREVKRRLRGWGAQEAKTFKVLTRDQVPPLTDAKAWEAFPFRDYDLLIVDSLDAVTEGVGEKDSAKPSKALAPILNIAHRPDGPAILILGNTVKSAQHSRGSGVVEDRADIVFEVRDATDLKPSGKTDWWLELPAAGASEWAERASARQRRNRYRLAFVPTKFRVGEEPDPFIWEIDLSGDPWVLRDVTESVLDEGQMVSAQERAEKENRTEVIVQELVAMVRTRAKAENPMRSQKEAVPFLTNRGYTRDAARDLIEALDGQNWKIWMLKDQRGSPKVLMPLSPDRPISNDSAEIIPDGKNLVPIRVSETPISATPMDTRPQKSEVTEPLSDKGFRDETLFPPRYSDKDPKQQKDDPDNAWEGF